MAYGAALKEQTRGRLPLDWAKTQRALGDALLLLGEGENGTEHVERGVVAYRGALQEYTREDVPKEWAATQHLLGYALSILGEREGDRERLEEAVAAYRAAYEVLVSEGSSRQVDLLQKNLNRVLHKLDEWGTQPGSAALPVETGR